MPFIKKMPAIEHFEALVLIFKTVKNSSLRVARIHGLFVYARLISQSRGSIPSRAWC